MRIEQIYIEGYGIFRDFSLEPFNQLNVILGENEAGKSTILSFIRTILFGFSDARTNEKKYSALRGGRNGGRLALSSASGDLYTIERFAGKKGGTLSISLPNGTLGEQSHLSALLEPASKDLFKNVFAFSLDELQPLSSNGNSEISTRIYSAGLGAAKLPLHESEKQLTAQREELFKGRGEKQTINRLLKELESVEMELSRLSENTSRYDALRNELSRAEILEKEKQACYRKTEADLIHALNLAQAWDSWVDLNGAQDRFSEIPAIEQFPQNGKTRMETLLARKADKRCDLDSARIKLQNQQQGIQTIQVNRSLISAEPEIDGLHRSWEHYAAALADFPKLEAQLQAESGDIHERLRQLGPGWNEQKVNDFDLSITVRQTVFEYREQIRSAQDNLKSAEHESGRVKEDLEALQRQRLQDSEDTEDTEPGSEPLPASPHFWPVAFLVLSGVISTAWLWTKSLHSGLLVALMGLLLFAAMYIFYYKKSTKAPLKNFIRQMEIRLQEKEVERDEKLKAAEAQLEEISKKLRVWLRGRGLEPTLSPDVCLTLLEAVRDCAAKMKALEGLRLRVNQVRNSIRDFECKANDLLNQVGLYAKKDSYESVIADLKKSLEEAKQKVQKLEHLNEALQETNQGVNRLEQELERMEQDIRELLLSSGAQDEEDFFKRAEAYQERTELQSRIRDLNKNLERFAGRGEKLHAFIQELESRSPEELQLLQQEREKQKEELRKEMKDCIGQCATLKEQIRALENEEEASAGRLRAQVLRAQIEKEVKEWSVLTLALKLLQGTIERYERERQPAVVQDAQVFFSKITGGKYPKILAPPNEKRIDVLDAMGARRTDVELSRGTAEQLYLSLRFGLIREFGRHSEALPVILDDILVNFDAKRARETSRALVELSRTHQVILFTCHSHLVDLIQQQDKECQIFQVAPIT